MAIEINNGLGPLSQRGGKTPDSEAVSPVGKESKTTSGSSTPRQESVQISEDAHSVRNLASQLEQQESFDEVRVNEIRQAISEGNYPIDNQRLAENFLQLESKL